MMIKAGRSRERKWRVKRVAGGFAQDIRGWKKEVK
jgi:hypothetical protein